MTPEAFDAQIPTRTLIRRQHSQQRQRGQTLLTTGFAFVCAPLLWTCVATAQLSQPSSPSVQSAPPVARPAAAHELPKEAMDFVRGIALLLLPEKVEDDDNWGNTTRVQSGVDWDWDNGRLETRRRWKDVNHGSWTQASGTLVDPASTFQLSALKQPAAGDDPSTYSIRLSARLRITGRQQQWAWGTRLWSISADAEADVSLSMLVSCATEIIKTDDGTRLRLKPIVDYAHANLDSLSVRRVSHLKGSVVRETDDWLERLLKVWIDRENKDLAERINKALAKQADELEMPFEIGSWFVTVPKPAHEADAGATAAP